MNIDGCRAVAVCPGHPLEHGHSVCSSVLRRASTELLVVVSLLQLCLCQPGRFGRPGVRAQDRIEPSVPQQKAAPSCPSTASFFPSTYRSALPRPLTSNSGSSLRPGPLGGAQLTPPSTSILQVVHSLTLFSLSLSFFLFVSLLRILSAALIPLFDRPRFAPLPVVRSVSLRPPQQTMWEGPISNTTAQRAAQ